MSRDYEPGISRASPLTRSERRPAVFLDRDGVIIENRDRYVRAWEDVEFLPGALEAVRRLAETRYAIVVVTNQSAVGRGLVALERARDIEERVEAEIERSGGRIDAGYLCPHAPAAGCACRKPRPGMLLRAAADHGLDLTESWMVGDARTDLDAGRAVGARSLLVRTGRGADQAARFGLPSVPDLTAAVAAVLSQSQSG